MQGKANLYEKILFTISFLFVSYGYIKIFYFADRGSTYLYWGLFFSLLTILPRITRHYLRDVRPRELAAYYQQAEIDKQKEQEEWRDLYLGVRYHALKVYEPIKRWGINLIGKVLQLLDDLIASDYTYQLNSRYNKWHNNYLIKRALDYESKVGHYFKVTVEDSEIINELMILSVKYENMTKKSIRSYIPNCLSRETATERKNIHIHEAGENLVKVIIEL